MPSMQESLFDSLVKDLDSIENHVDKKSQRKEYSLLLKRIESAKKLFEKDENLLVKLNEIEKKLRK